MTPKSSVLSSPYSILGKKSDRSGDAGCMKNLPLLVKKESPKSYRSPISGCTSNSGSFVLVSSQRGNPSTSSQIYSTTESSSSSERVRSPFTKSAKERQIRRTRLKRRVIDARSAEEANSRAMAPRKVAPGVYSIHKRRHDFGTITLGYDSGDRLASTCIEFVVSNGEGRRTFPLLHEQWIRIASPFLRQLLKEQNKSVHTFSFEGYGVEEETIEILHHWISTRSLQYIPGRPDGLPLLLLSKLWEIGDYLEIPVLQDEVTAKFYANIREFDRLSEVKLLELLNHLYRNAAAGNKALRKMIYDKFMLLWLDGITMAGWISAGLLPKQLVRDIAAELILSRGRQSADMWN